MVNLTNYFLFVATISLVIQLVVLTLLLFAFQLKRRYKFRLHGFVMLSAFLLHIASIVVIMGPAYVVALWPKTLKEPFSPLSLFSSAHALAGSATLILAAWIMVAWRLRRSMEYCIPRKKMMRTTFIVWLVSLGLGIVFYLALNWKLLFG